ncbi:GPCR fungal pheromone mating factor, partial [Lineolata rhizophorae]
YPLYPAAVILPTLAAVVILLDVPPLVWHARNRNLAAFSLVSWIILLNLFNFVNPLIWPRDDIPNWWNGEGLCDIQARLIVGASVGVPGCMLCIMLSLARVLDTDRGDLTPTKSQRFRRRLMELLLCFGFPIVIMIVYYVVQSRRYWIHGIAGCNWDYHPSWASIVVVLVWPTVLEVFDAIIAALVITRLFKYHKDFASILEASNTTASRFVRLFCMTLILIVGTLPVQVYVLAYNMSGPLQPYSWSEVHGDSWDTIMTVPSYGTVLFYRWTWIVMGFLVFVFFGMGRDASSMYRRWLEKLGF